MIVKKFDIAVIGGGPSGSAAAMLLSEHGYSVALIEKKNFPREVLCGEFVSKEVIEFLKTNSLYNDFLKLNPNPISLFRFIGSNGIDVSSSLDFPSYGIKRSKLDHFLLSKAIERGAEIFQPVEVKELSWQDNGYLVTLKSDIKEESKIQATIIIAAYGKQNILDKLSGRDFYSEKSLLNGIKFHIERSMFKNYNPAEIIILDGPDIYMGLNAVDPNIVTLCFLERRSSLHYSPKERLFLLSRENKAFESLVSKEFFDRLDNLPVYGTGNIYFGKKDIVKDGIFYIGDTAGVIAPLAGDGIGMAVQSASLLAEILIRNNLQVEISETEYRKEWRTMFLRRLYVAGLIQKIVLNNSIKNIGLKMVSLYPGLLSKIIKYTRG